jgi:hypothetical protein
MCVLTRTLDKGAASIRYLVARSSAANAEADWKDMGTPDGSTRLAAPEDDPSGSLLLPPSSLVEVGVYTMSNDWMARFGVSALCRRLGTGRRRTPIPPVAHGLMYKDPWGGSGSKMVAPLDGREYGTGNSWNPSCR